MIQQDIRKLVAYVPQEHLLFARSVEANILIGKNDRGIKPIWQIKNKGETL